MLLQKDRISHLETITHEGKVLLFGTDVDGKVWYTTRQEGFEPQFVATPAELRTGWEPWRELELPADAEDTSVIEREQAELTLSADASAYLIRSRYHTRNDTAVAPVELLSAQGHLYVFRQSKAGTLYCDRFVLNGGDNTLTRKLEVRYKRSKQKYAAGAGFRDTLDFSDLDGNYFFEPTTELCLIHDLRDGWFSIVLVPTNEHDVHRWHIFAYDAKAEQLQLTTLSASEDGLFDPHDFTVYEPTSAGDPTPVPRVVPGIQRRALDLGATVTNGFAAVRYDVQREGGGETKPLFKTATRIMLAVPTNEGTAALSFAIARDGMLSRIGEETSTSLLRSIERLVAMPLSALDEIRPLGDTSPPPHGVIIGMARGTFTQGAEDKVVIVSPEAGMLEHRDTVEITGTKSYDGVYQVSNMTPHSFEISVQWVAPEVGSWRKDDHDAGLVFDGMVTAYEKTPEGTLRVTAPYHGLEAGDEVEITGTRGYDGLCPVTKLSDTQLILDKPWPDGEAVNLTALRRKRRGLVLDGADDYVELPPDTVPAGKALTVSFWAKAGAALSEDAVILSAVGPEGQPLLRISVPGEGGAVVLELDSNGQSLDRATKPAEPSSTRWIHWTFVRDALGKELRIYRNGVPWHSEPGKDQLLPSATRVRLGASAEGEEATRFYQGELGDLRIFGRVLGDDEIRRSMYAPLTGREVGLCAYYRLAALRDGIPPTVVDFSTHAHDGVVHGGAYVGIVSLPRMLVGGLPATKYSSSAMVAVEELGVYVEEFEFRVNAAGPVSLASLADFGGKGTPIFQLSGWGKADRGSSATITIPVAQEPFAELDDGFFRVSGRFTVPSGVAMVRAFEVAEVAGEFVTLEIRRHRLRKLDDVVTEASVSDSPTLGVLADGHTEIASKVAELRVAERKEAELQLEQSSIARRLDGLVRLEETKLRLDSLRSIVATLREEERIVAEEHGRQVASPFNYYCVLGNRGAADDDRVQVVQRKTLVLEMQPADDVPSQKWRFRPATDGAYFLESAATGAGLRVLVPPGDTTLVEVGPSTDAPAQQWRAMADGEGDYYLYNVEVGDNRRLQASKQGNAWKVELQSAGNDPRHHFSLQPTGEQCTTAIADALAAWEELQANLTRMEAELAELEAIVAANEPQRVAWRTRLHQIVAELSKLQADMDRLNQEITSALATTEHAALVMPQVAEDGRGLTTLGAMLEGARSASRVSARESCEGNVELDYFDTDGRIRTTTYDATADSRNATFEQWLPDGQRACLSLAPRRGTVELSTPLDLAPEHTLEAWAYFPLPARSWNVLASDRDGAEQPIVACGGTILGVRSQGYFFGTDASLAELSTGWHHVAAVKQGAGKNVTIAFYVDGKPFGSPVSPRATALLLDGLNDSITLPKTVVPTGAQVSVSFWAQGNSSRPSTVLQAVDSLGLPVLSIGIPGADGALSFECGNDGQATDRIDKLAQRDEYRTGWAHFTFTKNALTGSMRIYRNGALWHAQSGQTKFLPQATAVVVGRAVADTNSCFEGRISDLRVWSRELSEDEVGALLGAPLPGLSTGLLGHYRFEGAGATDSSEAGRHGTIQGAPKPLDVIASPSRIGYLGNGPALSQTRPTALPKRAMRFDGVDDHVALPPMEFDGTTGLTVEAWIKHGAFNTWSRVIDLGNGAVQDNVLLVNNKSTNALRFVIREGTKDHHIEVPGFFEQGQWVHVAVAVDPTGQATVYKNGRQVKTGALFVAPQVLRSQCFIGKNLVPGEGQLDGQLAELRLWTTARSPLQIQDSMYHRLTGREPELLSYWPLDDVRSDVAEGNVADLAGDHAGTATNDVVVTPADDLPVSALDTSALQDECFGRLAEVRVWGLPLPPEELATNAMLVPSGNEPGLAAYYPLSEGQGSEVRDASRRHEPGTVRSRLSAAVMSLDGANDSVKVPDAPELRLTTYTVELWMRPNGVPNEEWNGVFGKPGRCFHIWLHKTGYIHHRFHLGGNSNAGAPNTAAGSIKWHEWNHIAITNDGKLARTYINGRLAAEGPAGGMPTVHESPLLIGRHLDDKNSHFYEGRLADVRLWNHARAAEEILASMHAPLSGTEEGLVANWPMNAIKTIDGTRTLVDLTGKHHGVLTECTTVADAALPIAERSRQQADDGQWWGYTAVMGNLGHQAMAFDGKDDHLVLPPMDVDWSQGLTLEGWVWCDSFESWSRIFDLGNGKASDNLVLAAKDASGRVVLGVLHGDSRLYLEAPGLLELGRWIHVAATVGLDGTTHFYKNGALVHTAKGRLPKNLERTKTYTGRSNWDTDGYFHGRMSELRIWTKARSQAEIRMTMHERLTGREPELAGYWPLQSIQPGPSGAQTEDRTPNVRHATLAGAELRHDELLPLGADALVAAEHRAADIDPVTDRPYLLMRCQYAYPSPRGVHLLADQRIEALSLEWVGNAQFAPTLLGYIEGAPPVPSENLTESNDYNSATSVELVSSEDTEFRWSRNEEFGVGGSLDLFIGAETDVSVGLGAYTNVLDLRVGAKASLNFSKSSMHETNITSSSSLRMTDRLELRGTPEQEPKFPHLGTRFIPKNVGYALVISGLADVYVTRLARSRKMLSYQVRPVEGVPPEVNTITFLMNPAYTMQGSLDGMTGSQPTSGRFHQDVGQLRAELGSSYPASFYRRDEAQQLQEKIDRLDKGREAYFQQFQIKPGFEEYAQPEETSASSGYEFEREVTDEVKSWSQQMQTAWKDPEVDSPPDEWEDSWVKKWNKEQAKQQKKQAEERQGEQADIVEATKTKISTLVDKVSKINGELGLEEWQRKMEDIQVAAGKRNIVNTYVWDADGGLRSEAQSFATTVEHIIGGTFQMDASLGMEASLGVSAVKVELTALATMNMTQTVNKTETHTKGIELVVDLSGMESIGVTDYDDRPLMPGEKVDRYRFKSFYLEGSTDNYHEFFRRVVHPEWLRSGDEEAVALRQAMGKANKAWRVLHRVTYVERPGTAGQVRDAGREGPTVSDVVAEYLEALTANQKVLEGKVEKVMTLLETKLGG